MCSFFKKSFTVLMSTKKCVTTQIHTKLGVPEMDLNSKSLIIIDNSAFRIMGEPNLNKII